MTTIGRRIEHLEATVAELRKLLSPPGEFPLEWKIWASEARLLAAMARTGEISIDAACEVAGVNGKPTSPEVVRQHISRLRYKLSRRSIQISTSQGIGYYLNAYSLAQVRAAFRPSRV